MKQSSKIQATVISIKGNCSAGHKIGDNFEINCYKAGNLCGFFYHNIFPNLQTYEYGGKMPWWQGESLILSCPDPHNLLTIKIERKE
jgi:uncharacterized repeat protein (TIGR04076 family)